MAATTAPFTMTVHFRFDRTAFADPRDEAALADLVRVIVANPGARLEIEAHADQAGSDAYNVRLSRKRAEALVKRLMALGVDRAVMAKIGYYGEKRPLCREASSSCRQQNRRGIIRIIAAGQGMR
jgi:outer membrane protein OmpA-like peptidoglycan-associated protein